jgi:hypothetical protein
LKTTRYFATPTSSENGVKPPSKTPIIARCNPMDVSVTGYNFRVVTLEDGETMHNAFPDRSFKPDQS